MALARSASFWGAGMIVLQIIRALTIVCLLASGVACWTLIVKIDTSNGFFFFDAASLTFTSTICLFLTMSELQFFFIKTYFRREWPVFSDQHGLSWLGAAMVVIGCNILGKLNQPGNSTKSLGLPWWRLVLASGIVTITFGLFNIICSFIFRSGSEGITARLVRDQGSLAADVAAANQAPPLDDSYSESNASFHKDNTSCHESKTEVESESSFMDWFWRRKNTNKPANKPVISHPMPVHYDIERNAGSESEGETNWEQNEDRRSPILPHVRRPDTALHPINARRSSFYSQAHLSRF